MNSRNDLYHGNVDPKALRFDTVYFSGGIPLFPDEQILPFRGIRAQLKHNEPEKALGEIQIVNEFIHLVLAALDDGAAEAVRVCMDEPHLAWNSNSKTIASVFPQRVHFFYHVEGEPNDPPS